MKRKHIILLFLISILIMWILFSRFSRVTIRQLDDLGTVKITINFYIQVEQEGIEDKIKLSSERPGTEIIKNLIWIDDTTLEILAMEKALPKGFNTELKVGPLKTSIPGLYKLVKVNFSAEISPFLTGMSSIAASTGPIELDFSTPIKIQDLRKGLVADFDYVLRERYFIDENGKVFKDCSSFELVPKEPLVPGKQYEVKFDGLLSNYTDGASKTAFHRIFTVADVPKVVRTQPQDSERDVKLYDQVLVEFDEDMKEVDIEIEKMSGDIKLEGKTAAFKPHTVFVPNTTYRVRVTGKSTFGEAMAPYSFEFTTVDMGDKWWVEINLRPIQKVTVFRGNKIVKSMIASAGLPDEENRTPRGFFTLKDRGEYFWTERIQEGGLYWVRITDNYLIHSVPRDKDNEIIEEEFKKLGIPASHGCVRLKDEDAKWFYETVPSGTLVIIHD